MAASTAGAIKAFLEAQGLGVTVDRDQAPAERPWPRVTVSEGVAVVPDRSGDFGSANEETGVETATVDVWERWRDPASKVLSESYTLVPAIRRALHGAVLSGSPTHAYGVRVVSSIRLLEAQNNVVHTAITVEINRVI